MVTTPARLRTSRGKSTSQGSLLAIPLAVATTLVTATTVGAKIKAALTDYGGYVVDDTGSKAGGAALCMEPGVSKEVVRAYGPEQNFDITVKVLAPKLLRKSPLYKDLLAIYQALHTVTNNGPRSSGGGGTPRRPAPPPLCKDFVSKGTLFTSATARPAATNKSSAGAMATCRTQAARPAPLASRLALLAVAARTRPARAASPLEKTCTGWRRNRCARKQDGGC